MPQSIPAESGYNVQISPDERPNPPHGGGAIESGGPPIVTADVGAAADLANDMLPGKHNAEFKKGAGDYHRLAKDPAAEGGPGPEAEPGAAADIVTGGGGGGAAGGAAVEAGAGAGAGEVAELAVAAL
jgi:hypothetical protein